jgi:hypothetical protein
MVSELVARDLHELRRDLETSHIRLDEVRPGGEAQRTDDRITYEDLLGLLVQRSASLVGLDGRLLDELVELGAAVLLVVVAAAT